MKLVKDQLDKVRPLFEKGGKLEKLYPLFEAQETFMFVLPHRTNKGSHIRDPLDTKRMMSMVIFALVPCLLFGIYNVGHQYYATQGAELLAQSTIVQRVLIGLRYVVPIIIVSYASGGIWELIFAVVRKHEINEGFLVTGLLVPLIVPPTIPLWQVAVAVSFGVVIGKEVFGGTGMNVFNPALVARAFLFFSYPGKISGDKVWAATPLDAYTGATPLLVASTHSAGHGTEAIVSAVSSPASELVTGVVDYSWLNCFIGLIPGSIGETSALACVIGALILIGCGVGSWRIMASVVAGGIVTSLVMQMLAPDSSHFMALPFYWHLVVGGFAFGTVFMATDPVSASHTNTGKLIYGFIIGMVAVIVRVVNPAYPEGMMLAILFMNAFSPLIDYYVVQRNIARRLNYASA